MFSLIVFDFFGRRSMMKKLFVLVLVLAISSMATAAQVDLEIIAGPDPQGEYQGAPSYMPSDTITIALVGSGFDDSGSNPTAAFGGLKIATVTTNGGGTGGNPDLHTDLKGGGLYYVGTTVNSGGVLIQTIQGSVAMGDFDGVPNEEDAWWFEFHVPDADYSTIIVIDLTGLVIEDAFANDITSSVTYGGALEIHVVPEPMTIALLGLGGLFLRRRK
jgi:hypothetical protein